MNLPLSAFTELADALRERLAAIADRDHYQRDAAGHLERLKAASTRIDAAVVALGKPIPPDLAHYLHGSSFNKALAWLELHVPATRESA
jgi:hypothetical protein